MQNGFTDLVYEALSDSHRVILAHVQGLQQFTEKEKSDIQPKKKEDKKKEQE